MNLKEFQLPAARSHNLQGKYADSTTGRCYYLWTSVDGVNIKEWTCFKICDRAEYTSDIWVHHDFNDDELQELRAAGFAIGDNKSIKSKMCAMSKYDIPACLRMVTRHTLRNSIENPVFMTAYRGCRKVGAPVVVAIALASSTNANFGHIPLINLVSRYGVKSLQSMFSWHKLLKIQMPSHTYDGQYANYHPDLSNICSTQYQLGLNPLLLDDDDLCNHELMSRVSEAKSFEEAVEVYNNRKALK